MKIFITGGSGFVGTYLSNFLLDKGCHVTALGTRPRHGLQGKNNFRYIAADTTQTGAWQDELQTMDAAINLAGKTIAKRWTKRYKEKIYKSRILSTRNLVDALPQRPEFTLCSTSAVGYYGNRAEDILREDTPPGNDFLADIAADWEAEARHAQDRGVRLALCRFGMVLGRGGGALAKMMPAFRYFIGGPLGNGSQWFPWIHMQDLVSALLFILALPDINGPVNLTAPSPIRNRDLARILGRLLKRPAAMNVPAFMLQMMMGELGRSMLYSQRVVPDKLTTHGFQFKFPEIESALEDLI